MTQLIEPTMRPLTTDDYIRLGYITSRDLLDKGTAVFLKLNYPDIYNKLIKSFPEIRNHV